MPLLLLACLLGMWAPSPGAAGPTTTQQLRSAPDSVAILRTVDAFHRSLAAKDSTGALALLAPDAVIVESGDLETRQEYAAHHLSADIEFAQAVPSERRTSILTQDGDAAWVTSITSSRGTFRGRPVASQGAELMVLTRAGSTWRIRAIHWSSHRL